jgi:hypothetical protein
MKLQMYPIVVEVAPGDEVEISQPAAAKESRTLRITVEQVPFLVDLLLQAKSQIESDRYRRQNS